MKLCADNRIEQRFTKGKTAKVIKTIMELWHDKTRFSSSEHRKTELNRFVNYFSGVRPHKGIGGLTPEEKLLEYFYPEKPQTTLDVTHTL